MPTSLRAIAKKARERKDLRFFNLYRLIDEALLLDCWRDIRKNAAFGVDGISAEEYGENLTGNIRDLVDRVERRTYRARLVRRHWIPRPDGRQRPLGIPVVEDKLLQLAVTRILEAIYEQDFLRCSYGYRPNTGALDAVDKLTVKLQFGDYHFVVEADIQGFFDNLDQDALVEMLSRRIGDQQLLRLIRKWLRAGVLDTDGKVTHPLTGTAQGGIVSPILANVYLHHVLDLWFQEVVKWHTKGEACLIRYADDFVCAFQNEDEARHFFGAIDCGSSSMKPWGLCGSGEIVAVSAAVSRGRLLTTYWTISACRVHESNAGAVLDYSAGNGIQQTKRGRVVKLRVTQDLQFDFIQQAIVKIDASEIEADAGLDTDVGKALGDSCTIAFISDLLPDLGQIVLTVRVLNVRQQLGTVMHQMHAPAKQISSRAHVLGIDIGLRDHAAAQQNGDLLRIDLVVLGFAAVNGFHVQGITQNKSDAFARAEIGEPVPGENAFYGDDDLISKRSDRFQKRIRIGLHVAMKNDRTGLVQDAEVHGSRVQINSAVMRMLLRIEFHRPPPLSPFGDDSFIGMVDPSTKPVLGRGLNQYHAAAPAP